MNRWIIVGIAVAVVVLVAAALSVGMNNSGNNDQPGKAPQHTLEPGN